MFCSTLFRTSLAKLRVSKNYLFIKLYFLFCVYIFLKVFLYLTAKIFLYLHVNFF